MNNLCTRSVGVRRAHHAKLRMWREAVGTARKRAPLPTLQNRQLPLNQL
jgi:hypothetical protein